MTKLKSLRLKEEVMFAGANRIVSIEFNFSVPFYTLSILNKCIASGHVSLIFWSFLVTDRLLLVISDVVWHRFRSPTAFPKKIVG